MCIQYGITVEEFVSEVEAFRVNKGVDVIAQSHLGKIEEAIRNRSNDVNEIRKPTFICLTKYRILNQLDLLTKLWAKEL